MEKKRGKILVVRGGALGDFVLTLPVFSALRSRFPDTHLEVLGYPKVSQLAVAAGLVDEWRSMESRALAMFFARDTALDPEWVEYFQSFALIVSFLYDPDEFFRQNVTRGSAAQFIVGTHRPWEGSNEHATGLFLKPLERLAIFDADPQPRLEIPVRGDNLLGPGRWIALHPGSGSPAKNWSDHNWAGLCQLLLRQSDVMLLLISGEAEGQRVLQLARCLPEGRIRVAQDLPLMQLAQLMKQCTAYIGHDSGISHLAGALGLKGLLLWNQTNLAIWKPPSPALKVIRHKQGLDHLTLETVQQELGWIASPP